MDYGRVAEALPYVVPLGGMALGVLGLLWAVPGAVLCALVALLRKLDARMYGCTGARMSTYGLIPWLNLFIKITVGRPIPAFVAAPFYFMIYVGWGVLVVVLIAMIFLQPILSILDILILDWIGGRGYAGHVFFFALLSAMTLPFVLATAIMSARDMLRRYRLVGWPNDKSEITLPTDEYVRPFAWFTLWSAITFFILAAHSISRFDGG